SCPSIAAGIASIWIAVGRFKPFLANALSSCGSRSNSSKLEMVIKILENKKSASNYSEILLKYRYSIPIRAILAMAKAACFQFKQFKIYHDRCAMKVGTDGVLLGAWADVAGANRILDLGCGTGLIAL